MNIRPILLGCGLMLGAAAGADEQREFNTAYEAYRHAALRPDCEG